MKRQSRIIEGFFVGT